MLLKFIKTFIILNLNFFLVVLFNSRILNLPPLGKVLDPFNGIWQNAEKNNLKFKKKIFVKDINNEIKIIFDKNNIPHINAKDEKDLYFAMGYITAKDRLWSIDFATRAAEGRLSEIFGYNKKFLNFDIFQRQKCIRDIAIKCLKKVMKDSISRNCLESFSRGINSYISKLKYPNLPIEYKLLDYKPEEWSPYKTMLIIVAMADKLSGKDSSIEYTNAINIFGRKKFDFIYPDFPKGIKPIVPKMDCNFKPIKKEHNDLEIPSQIFKILVTNNTDPEIEGSNNWVVAKSKTKDKSIFLANDPHLDINLPSTFYIVHLKTPKINIIGGVGPGTPFVIIGNNEHVSFGLTNSLVITRNWYSLDFIDDNYEEYKYGDIVLKTNSKTEEIKIRGSKSHFQKILLSHYGPVFIPKNLKRKGLAMKWAGQNFDNIVLGFLKMNYAKNYDNLEKAFTMIDFPTNYAFATIDGDIGMYVTGKYPIRYKEQGKFILKGESPKNNLDIYIPHIHAIKEKNPSRGYVLSANQHPTNKSYPYYLYSHKYRYFRNLRIKEILESKNDFTLEDMKNMQMDTLDSSAKMMLPIIFLHIDENELNTSELRLFHKLKEWNFNNDPEAIEPSIFKEWQKNIYYNLWSEIFRSDVKLFAPSMYRTIQIIKDYPDSKLLNLTKFTNMKHLVNYSFKKAIDKLENWKTWNKKDYKWADYRPVILNHIIPIFKTFGKQNLRLGGRKYSLCANEASHGVSLRYISKIKNKKIKSFFSYPGGQSGNPLSFHYTEYVKLWEKGKYLPLDIYFFDNRINENCSTLSFSPKN